MKKKDKAKEKKRTKLTGKIRILTTLGTPQKCFTAGSVHEIGKDISEEQAHSWLKSGAAEMFGLMPAVGNVEDAESQETLEQLIEKYEKLEEGMQKNKIKILQQELKEKKRVQSKLEKESLKAMVLKEPNWQEKESASEQNRSEIRKIEGKIILNKEVVEGLREKQEAISKKIKHVVYQKYAPSFDKACKAFVEKAEETLAAEEEMNKIAKRANDLVIRFKRHKGGLAHILSHEIFLPMALLTIDKRGARGERIISPRIKFFEEARRRGYR
jgi:hypothetical protein